jgi:bifunctional oligoribonuclease and PAP phosphatase NrnA
MQFKRSERVADRILEEVSDLLTKKVQDPRIGFVTLTKVNLSDDLRNATVWASVRGDQDRKQKTLEGLKAATSFIQKEVFKRLKIKVSTQLYFKLDDSLEKSSKIEKLLEEIKKEPEGPDSDAMAIQATRMLEEASFIALCTHINPDGDGLGCQLALAGALTQMGKKVFVFLPEELPGKYDFLPIEKYLSKELPEEIDLIVALDSALKNRLGEEISKFSNRIKILNIDHHISNEFFGNLNWVDGKASAAGEIVWRLLKELPVEINSEMAEGIYTAIATDTGGFRYSNTRPESLRIAAELMEHKIRTQWIHENIYENKPVESVRLWARSFSAMRLQAGGRIGIISISQEDFKACGADSEHAEGLAEALRALEGVEVAMVLREEAPEKIRASLRSKGRIDVNELAGFFGGGGHVRAAGAVLEVPLETAVEQMLEKAESMLD